MKCWSYNCENNVKFSCPCTNPSTYSCDLHINVHLRTNSKSKHHPEPLVISLNPDTKRALIDYLHQSLSNLYEFRRKTVHEFSIQIKQINDKMQTALKSFDQAIKEQRKIISQINLIEVISNLNKNKIDEILVLEAEESIEKLIDNFDIFDKSSFFIDDAGNFKKYENFLNESNSFIIFRSSSTKIVRTDLNNYESAEFNIPLDSSKSSYISMCLIPGNSIFCYGNYSPFANTAFIIEPDNTVKQAINAPYSLGLSGSIYNKNIVYFFGGYNESGYAENAFKYYLLENKWENLKPLLVKSSFVSCFAKNNKILLSGREHSMIYCYDIIKNTYKELHNIQSGLTKIVCGNDMNPYVIEAGGYIYEGHHNWKVWSTIGRSEIENTDLIGCKGLWKNKFYFAFCNYQLYEFDLSQRRCRMIKTI